MNNKFFILPSLVCASCSFDTQSTLLTDAAILDAATVDKDAGQEIPTGFSTIHEVWAVPESGSSRGFHTTEISSGTEHWLLVDLDGDNRLELVHTGNSSATGAEAWVDNSGQSWQVYTSSDGGFDSIASRRALPESGTTEGFYSVRQRSGTALWDMEDVDGDGLLDLIQTTDPLTGSLWTDGGSRWWNVFAGTADGFKDVAVWKVPDLGPLQFTRLNRCGDTGCWKLLDLSGDGLLDLVHSSDVPPITAWDAPDTPKWHVYLNSGSGFAETFSDWDLPGNERTRGFIHPDFKPYWGTLDLDGDSVLEIVQTRPAIGAASPYDADGVATWKMFGATQSGFALESTNWALPAGALFSTMTEAAGSLQWQLLDMNGDGRLDLVDTANSGGATPSVWGSPNSDQWKVYLGMASGFAPAKPWRVPDSGLPEGFYATSSQGDLGLWTTLDLDGDGQVELIQTADPSTGNVWRSSGGEPYWRIYRAE